MMLAFNEAQTIGYMISQVPREINGNLVKVCIVDDGSTDNTVEVAMRAGADYIWRHTRNRGVSAAFKTGVKKALKIGADVIVNMDADGQFTPAEIPALVRPIIAGHADIVLGSRFLNNIPKSMPIVKRVGNQILGRIISLLSGKKIYDTQCGFRAFTKRAAMSVRIRGLFTYTQEMILRAIFRGVRIVEQPISVRYFANRRSRVVRNIVDYAIRVIGVILVTLISEYARYMALVLLSVLFSSVLFYLVSPVWSP